MSALSRGLKRTASRGTRRRSTPWRRLAAAWACAHCKTLQWATCWRQSTNPAAQFSRRRQRAPRRPFATPQLEGGLAASVAVWIEQKHCCRNIGQESAFAEYLQWERAGRRCAGALAGRCDRARLLTGTDVEQLVAFDERALRDDFDREAWPVLLTALGELSNDYVATLDREAEFAHFVAAATLVSSRAFGVDGHHGDCMLPFAALFNHSTTQPHINVQDNRDEKENDDDGDDDDEDDGGSALSSDLETPSRITHLQIVAVRAAAAGDELLNTYGYHLSNRKLLHSYGFCQVRKIDEQLHRRATVQLLRGANDASSDHHFWEKIVRIFPNGCVSVRAELVRQAITDERDGSFLTDLSQAFVSVALGDEGEDDDDDDDNDDGEDGNDEDNDTKPKKRAKVGGSDDEEAGDDGDSNTLPLSLIAPSAEHNPPTDDDEEDVFDGPDSYDFRALFVGNALSVGADFRLSVLLRLLELDEEARRNVVNSGIPFELLNEIDCLGALEDDGGDDEAHHPSDEHDATFAQLQRTPLLSHCNFGEKARQLLGKIVELRLALYGSHASLADECHRLAGVLDAESPNLGREEFALMLRIGERSLLRLVQARLHLQQS
jgi:hypothetical protein